MRTDHPVARALFWFCVAAAVSCGGYSPPPPREVPAGQPPPEVDQGEAMIWRAPLFPDPGNTQGEGSGRIRVRSTNLTFEASVQVQGLQPRTTYRIDIDGNPVFILFVTDSGGKATAPLALGSSVPLPGHRVRVGAPSGTPLLLGTLPDWRHRPRHDGPSRAGFYDPSGGATVGVEVFQGSGRGLERLEFRFAGFDPGTTVLLRLEGGEGISIVTRKEGSAILRWRSRFPSPLPLGAYSVGELRGMLFEVLVGGAVVVEGTIP